MDQWNFKDHPRLLPVSQINELDLKEHHSQEHEERAF